MKCGKFSNILLAARIRKLALTCPTPCRGQSSVVLRPQSTNDVSKLLGYCNTRKYATAENDNDGDLFLMLSENCRLAVVPQGGNTGLVGQSLHSTVYSNIYIHYYRRQRPSV